MLRTLFTAILVCTALFTACTELSANRRSVGEACASEDECSSNLCYESTCYDPAADEDLDGLTNGLEAKLQTKLTLADSDGDGLSDYAEVAEQYEDPPDSDGDGTIDALESLFVALETDGDCIAPQDDVDDVNPDLFCCCGASCKALGVDVIAHVCDSVTGVLTCVFSDLDDLDTDGLLPDCDDDDDGDGVDDTDDCAPDDATRSPKFEERCDGVDNDCDEVTDEEWPELESECLTAHPDCGGFAFPVCNESQDGVECLAKSADEGTSCEDGNPQTQDDRCDASGNCGGIVCDGEPACIEAEVVNGSCLITQELETCFIDGTCYAAGVEHPAGSCKRCDPNISPTNWTAAPAGTGCDDGDPLTLNDLCVQNGLCAGSSCDDGAACTSSVIQDGVCVYLPLSGACFIEGECYLEGETKLEWPCKRCDPLQSQEAWSALQAGTSCDDNDTCTVGDVCGPDAVCDGDSVLTDDCLYDCSLTGSVVGTSPAANLNASGHTVFAGDYAYVLQNKPNGEDIEMSIVDLSDGTNPLMALSPSPMNDINFPRRGLINAPGDYLYVSSNAGFQVVDVAEPTNSQTLVTHTVNGQLYGMAHHPYEPVVYVAAVTWAAQGSLVSINVASPGNLTSKVHAVQLDVETSDVAVGPGNRFYLSGTDLSLQGGDITAPNQPVVTDALSGIEAPTDGAETVVVVQGALAVVASTRDGYRLVDISDSAEMELVYEGASPSQIYAADFFESYLLLASKDQGLVILDIALPATPEVVATIEVGGTPRGVHVVGHRVFVSTSTYFLKVIDLNLPCTDGDFCTLDACQVQGGCEVVADTACDDMDPCTIDSCDSETGCVFTEDLACIEAGIGPP